MQLIRTYQRVRFSAEIIEEALAAVRELGGDPDKVLIKSLSRGADEWTFESVAEWLGEYRQGCTSASLWGENEPSVKLGVHSNTKVTVRAKTRDEIQRLIAVFDRHVDESRLPEPAPPPPPPPPPKPRIFIGHGLSPAWRDLKDHLHEQHGHDVEAYETGARAGHTIRDVLDGMATRANFAVLVLTGDDLATSGTDGEDTALRARQNVVHEVGLFQGRLGWDRAIVAIEDGVDPFSNLQGINQLRFAKGNVREIFGDVLATLRREFPAN